MYWVGCMGRRAAVGTAAAGVGFAEGLRCVNLGCGAVGASARRAAGAIGGLGDMALGSGLSSRCMHVRRRSGAFASNVFETHSDDVHEKARVNNGSALRVTAVCECMLCCVSLRLQGGSDAGSSSSDEEEDGAEEQGGEEGAEQRQQMQAAGEAANGAAGDVTMGEATDGGGASGPDKKRRRRRDSIEGYERDFIDDGEEIEYESRRTAKAKFKGFCIIRVR